MKGENVMNKKGFSINSFAGGIACVFMVLAIFGLAIFSSEKEVQEASIKYESLKDNLAELESYGIDISKGPAGSLPDILDLLEVCYGE